MLDSSLGQSRTIKCNFILFLFFGIFIPAHVHGFGILTTKRIKSLLQPHKVSSCLFMSSPTSMIGVKSLGVDYGLMRTGLAVTTGYAPSPLTILHNSNQTEVIQDIIKIVVGESASQIVVGLPLHKNGTLSEQANITKVFATQLAYHCHCQFGPKFPIYLFDERYSSKEAEARIKSSTSSPSNRKLNSYQLSGTLDADSACIILEHYYAAEGEGKIRAFPPSDEIANCELLFQQLSLQKQKDVEELQRKRESSLTARQAAMEKVRLMEEQMARDGTLKKGKKKKKKKKQKNSSSLRTDGLSDSSENKRKDKWITL